MGVMYGYGYAQMGEDDEALWLFKCAVGVGGGDGVVAAVS